MTQAWFVVDWQCCLGAGGEGEVFLGRSLETWELCAIKVSAFVDPAAARAELAKELERCTRAAGDGVVGVVGWNLDAPRPFLVFEFARAGSLADEVTGLRERGHVYHPVRALERVREVLSALAKVHDRGLVHRDVKPANLLRFGGRIKVADFGTCRTLDRPTPAAGQGAVPGDGFVGTRAYAAPEQLRGEEVDARTDLYAVGCILWEMLCGDAPNHANSAGGYPNLLVLPQLDQLLRSLLSPQRSRRPRDAQHAIALVDSVLASYRTARSAWEKLRLGPSPY